MKEEYRQYHSWEEAIKLSQQVHGLIESLPSDESSALAASLNAAAVSVPANVALNIMLGQPADIRYIVELQTQIELVNRIYPALDTASVERAASQLLERLQSVERFREMVAAKPEPTPEPEAEDEPEAEAAAEEEDKPAHSTKIDVQAEA